MELSSSTVTVVGMCTVDTFLEVGGGFGDDESALMARAAMSRLGGKGYLVAEAMAAVGSLDVALVAEVARSGSAFVSDDGAGGRGLRGVLDRDHHVWVVTSSDGVQRTLVRPGVRGVPKAEVHSPQFATNIGGALYISAEDLGLIRAAYGAWASSSSGAPLALNPCVPLLDRLSGQDGFLRQLLKDASYVFLNEHEHQRLLSGGFKYAEDSLVAVTGGAAGGRYRLPMCTDWSQFAAVPCSESGVTSAGSGDIFNGTVLGALGAAVPIRQAMSMGAVAASAYIGVLRAAIS